MRYLNFDVTAFPSCCGLRIVHRLGTYRFDHRHQSPNLPPCASIAVTNQVQTAEAAALEERGYKAVATFAGNYNRNTLTLWLRDRPTKAINVPTRSGRFISRATGRPVTDAWALRNPTRVRTT